MEEEKSYVLEWSIDNFSCWDGDIHGKAITSPKSNVFSGLTIELYPRGRSGHDDYLVVDLGRGFNWASSDELSYYIGSNGSLICMQQVDSRALKLPPGPRFDEVVSQIKKNESGHKDRLILRLRDNRGDSVEYMRTKIDVFDASVKISPKKILDDFESLVVLTSKFTFPLDEGEMGEFLLTAYKDKDEVDELKLILRPKSFDRKTLVLARTTLLTSDGNIAGIDESEHLFVVDHNWDFSKSLTREKVEGCSLILDLRIIPSNKPKHALCSQYVFPLYVRGVSSIPSNDVTGNIADTSAQPDDSVLDFFPDLIRLQCGDRFFSVSRSILSTHSPVFKRLLTESSSRIVHIEDLDAPTLARFLDFLYNPLLPLEDLEVESAFKLYYAADKYQVPTLQRKCVSFLSANVSVSNVCDILSYGDRHRDEQLTSVAIDFILGNYNKVLRSEDWKSFIMKEPLLAVETVTQLTVKNFVIISKAKSFLRVESDLHEKNFAKKG